VPNADVLDWKTIASWLGWFLSVLLSGLGLRIWNQVNSLRDEMRTMKNELVSRTEFERTNAASAAARDQKHLENTGNFERIDNRLTVISERQSAEAISIERRLGEVLTKIAELRPTQRQEGPERRRGY